MLINNNRQIRNFYQLDAWRSAHQLILFLYRLSESFPRQEQYGLTSQLRRAGVSITANIAEGFQRYHFKDKTKFYYQARGSLAEVYNFLILAKDLGLLEMVVYKKAAAQVELTGKLINGLISSTSRRAKE